MADDADIAADHEQTLLDLRLAEVLRTARLPARVGIACLICGEEISAARRAALPNACTCVDCQGRFERRPA